METKKQKDDVTTEDHADDDDGSGVTSSSDEDDVDDEVDDRSIVQGKQHQDLINKENKKASKKNGFEIAPANHGISYLSFLL